LVYGTFIKQYEGQDILINPFAIPTNTLLQTIFSVFRKPTWYHSNENIFKKICYYL